METRNHDLSGSRGDGQLRFCSGRIQYYYGFMDRNPVYRSADVLHFPAADPAFISHHQKNREFVINLTTAGLAYITDWCGVKSGRDVDKFKETGLTPGKASKVKAPLIEESPLNIECAVKNILPLGSHDMFVSEVLAVHADEQYLGKKDNVFRLSQAGLIAYSHGRYFELGRQVGTFGFSVKKRKKKKKGQSV